MVIWIRILIFGGLFYEKILFEGSIYIVFIFGTLSSIFEFDILILKISYTEVNNILLLTRHNLYFFASDPTHLSDPFLASMVLLLIEVESTLSK